MLLETIVFEKLLCGPPAELNKDGKSVTAKLILDCKCQLGECILYDDKQDAIVFTDILNKQFYKLSLKEKTVKCFDVPKMLCAFSLLSSNSIVGSTTSASSSAYLCAWEDGFQFYDLENRTELSPMSTGEVVNPKGLPNRLNDGRCDPSGKFFICGGCTLDIGTKLKVYKCYQQEEDGKLYHEPIVDQIKLTNSICWSPDSKTMYLADSISMSICSHDYNVKDGTLSNKKFLHKKYGGIPDGSIVDADGYIWNAVWKFGRRLSMILYLRDVVYNGIWNVVWKFGPFLGTILYLWDAIYDDIWNAVWKFGPFLGMILYLCDAIYNVIWKSEQITNTTSTNNGKVERIDPQTGAVVFTVYLPDNTSQVTCCCIGGKNLDILFITTAAVNRGSTIEPHAGGMYAVKLPNNIKGCKEARFQVTTKSLK